jgi:hypothetical protein
LTISNLDNSLTAYAFDLTAENAVIFVLLDLCKVGCDDLKLKAGTSGIQD